MESGHLTTKELATKQHWRSFKVIDFIDFIGFYRLTLSISLKTVSTDAVFDCDVLDVDFVDVHYNKIKIDQ